MSPSTSHLEKIAVARHPGIVRAVRRFEDDPDFLFVDTDPGIVAAAGNEKDYQERFTVPPAGDIHSGRLAHEVFAQEIEKAMKLDPSFSALLDAGATRDRVD